MTVIFSRMIVVNNDTPWEIRLREIHASGLSHCISLPAGRSEFPASHFLKRNHAIGSSTISIEVDGRKSNTFITPEEFLNYVKITFYNAGDRGNFYCVVPARSRDLCRIWGFGWLGRTYPGRPGEEHPIVFQDVPN